MAEQRGFRYVSHPCPICSVTVTQPLDPGRRRVYCSNACKQTAYRNRIRSAAQTGYGSGAWRKSRDWYREWENAQRDHERTRYHQRRAGTGPVHDADARARALRLIAQMERLINDKGAYEGERESARRRVAELRKKYGL